ncbi:Ger(x)C family germination protein [Orenia metallireducens]|uniref:Germination protein, Ger(X)C family n=1 Tax=Orenia metallireducens TaxID=1413210 RepID=A0A285GSR7_9FIRM|nr:Ger(x)C family spore germination protein [Orenia metallireducens]PRX32618.1 Ger(x)C family germination protein [Orenia metallireducens]SNY26498.1 germination protein, Ger(x)C family [Orenia metallireducens]
MKFIKLIIFLIIVLFISGCWDRSELERQAYIVAIGLDQGRDKNVEVTYLIANPQGGGGPEVGTAQGEPPSEVITLEVPDIVAGLDLLNATVPREINFGHISTLIISEKFARGEQLIYNLDAAIRERQTGRKTFVIVSKEKASDFIRGNKPLLETRANKFYDFMRIRLKKIGIVGPAKLHYLLKRTESKDELFLAAYATVAKKEGKGKKQGYEDDYLPGEIPKKGGNPTQIIGSAVFKEGKMVGRLTGEETRLALLLRPHYKTASMIFTFPDPISKGYRVTMRLKKHRDSELKLDLSEDDPNIKTTISIVAHILAIVSGNNYTDNLQKQELLKKSIEDSLENKIKDLIDKTQKDFRGEPFLWVLEARKKFTTFSEYRNYNWIGRYPYAKVEVKVEVDLKGFGKQVTPTGHRID